MSVEDVFYVKECNKRNLPENYHIIFLLYLQTMYAECCFVAENSKGEVVGYSISKLKDSIEKEEKVSTEATSGYVISVAVDKGYRRQGLGKVLLGASLHGVVKLLEQQKQEEFKVYLNVRVSNTKAVEMYKKTFLFREECEEKSYYMDGESAFLMSRIFQRHESE